MDIPFGTDDVIKLPPCKQVVAHKSFEEWLCLISTLLVVLGLPYWKIYINEKEKEKSVRPDLFGFNLVFSPIKNFWQECFNVEFQC